MKKPIRGIEDNRILTTHQKKFLHAFGGSRLKDIFRLSGGTALSAFYLEHRLSEDLDFFSSERIPFYVIEEFLKTLNFIDEIFMTKHFERNIFNLKLGGNNILKVEFTYYPLKNIQKAVLVESLQIDSFIDIVVNKLCAIADRIDVKDYVDVYLSIKNNEMFLRELIDFAEKKCEIKGIRHILKSRLLQIPTGIESLPLKYKIKQQAIKNLFKRVVRDIVEEEIFLK